MIIQAIENMLTRRLDRFIKDMIENNVGSFSENRT